MKLTAKKLLFAAGVTACAAAFAACGGSASKETTAAATTAAAATAGAEAAASGSDAVAKPESYGTVTLGQYKGIDVETAEVTVTDDEVQSYIDSVLASNPDETEVDRAAKEGDVVNIDYVGKKDGEAFDGGTGTGYDLELGSGTFIDGFEDGLIGVKKGEKKDLNLTFPEDYQATDLAGKAVVFEVTVNSVKEKKDAVLDDAWVEKYTNGQQTTVDAYKASVRSQLEKQRQQSEENVEFSSALQTVIDGSSFDMNPDAVAYEAEQQKQSMIQQLGYYYGMDLDSYLQAVSMTQEDFDKEMQTSGENIVKQKLVLDQIFSAEDMTVGDADYSVLEQQFGMAKSMLIQYYGQEAVDNAAKQRKVLRFLIDNAHKIPRAEAETTAAAETTEAAEETTAAATTEAAAK